MSQNNPLFKVGETLSVDMETGEAVPVEGGGLRMLPAAPGCCPLCHTKHRPEEPHNPLSLPYRIKFHELHKRLPTWADAMAHCSEETQAIWKKAAVKVYAANGVELPEELR